MSKHILIPLATGFEKLETVTLIDVLRRIDLTVTLTCIDACVDTCVDTIDCLVIGSNTDTGKRQSVEQSLQRS